MSGTRLVTISAGFWDMFTAESSRSAAVTITVHHIFFLVVGTFMVKKWFSVLIFWWNPKESSLSLTSDGERSGSRMTSAAGVAYCAEGEGYVGLRIGDGG